MDALKNAHVLRVIYSRASTKLSFNHRAWLHPFTGDFFCSSRNCSNPRGDCMMVTRRFLLLCVFLTLLTMPVPAQNSAAPTQTREGGLVNTTFTTPSAKITVTLPDDIAAGDTISGTVVAEPAGKNDAEKQHNAAELTGYVIEVGDKKTPVPSGIVPNII